MRSVPGADRGPRAGSPRGVVDATGSNRFSSIGGWDLTQQTRLLYKLPRFITNTKDNT